MLAGSRHGIPAGLACPVVWHVGPPRQAAQSVLACTTQAHLCLFRALLQQRYREPRCGTAASHAPPAPMSDGSCSPAPCWHCGHHHALSQGPTHPMPVSAAWGPSNWIGWVLSQQPQNPAGSTAVHQGQARQRPRCHAGMVPFISRGQRKEEEPCALHAKAALWLPAGEQGRRQTKQQLPRLLAMRVPKPVSPGTPRHSAGWSHMPQRDKRCCRQSPASSPWPCSQQVLGNLEEGQDCAQPGSSSAGWWPGTTTSLARRAGRR